MISMQLYHFGDGQMEDRAHTQTSELKLGSISYGTPTDGCLPEADMPREN